MADWLYLFPDSVLIAGSALLVAGAVVLLPKVIRLVRPGLLTTENTDFIFRIHGTLFTLTGFALAFTLVQAQANFRNGDAVVNAEAGDINNLDRLLTRYGDPSVTAIRPALLAYATSIARDEWPTMAHDRGSDRTRALFPPVTRAVAAIKPVEPRQISIYGEMLKSLDAIVGARETRLEIATQGLPGTYWTAVLAALGVLVVASSMVVRTPFRTFFLGAQMAVLGAFMGIVFITDHPFKGETSIGPTAIERVIATIKARDR
jgi:hypothetical protein